LASLDEALRAADHGLTAARRAVPGVLVAWLGLSAGGYFPLATATAAVLALGLVVIVAVASQPAVPGWSLRLALAAVPLCALAAWTFASSRWSGSPGRAAVEADRVILYGALLLTAAALGWTPARARTLVGSMLAGIVAVCTVALVADLLPGVLGAANPAGYRLSYPVTYSNALGLLAGIGLIFAMHASASLEEHTTARCAGAAAIPLLAATLLLTLSRSAVWSTAAGLLAYLIVARPRGLAATAIATVPTTFVGLLALDHGAVVGAPPAVIRAYGLGTQPAWLLATAIVAAGLLRRAGVALDRPARGLRRSTRARVAMACATIVLGLVAVTLVVRFGIGMQLYDRFATGMARDTGAARLTSLSNNNRLSKWRVAVDDLRASPLHGSGAGTYELSWERARHSDGHVRDAHSLYLEMAGELGVPGVMLLLAAVLAMIGGLAARARGPTRAAPAALLGGGVAWALSAAVDWDWEMPVVTGMVFMAGGLALARSAEAGAAAPRPRATAFRLAVVVAALGVAVLPVRIAWSEARVQQALAAARESDCSLATAAARRSLDAMAQRWEPWQVLGVCQIRRGEWRAASASIRRAVRLDPGNWMPRYLSAVTRARLGLDARPELAVAAAENPREPVVRAGWARLADGTAGARRRAAVRAALPLP
jgi:hypothetical protein